MLKFSKFALLSALLAAAVGAQAADDKPAALVNGVSIPQARVDLRVKVAMQQNQVPDSPDVRSKIRDELVTLEILSQAATKAGLDKQPETTQRLEITRQNILADALVQDYVKAHPISDDMLKQEYETFKKRVGNTEYQLSHILVATEDEAKKAAAELKKKGMTFAKVAKSMSIDGTKEKGGDLGWTIPAKFVQPFAEAVLKLKKGEVSAPVQTQFGWHIIKLENTRDLKLPSLDEMKANLENNLQQQAIAKYIEELRSKAKVE
jgi:peptidyl-prolyl cis-trans isomerase C